MWEVLVSWGFKFFIIPIFSKAVTWFLSWYQEHQAEEKRSAEIDAALRKFQEAQTAKEQEDAFKELIRRRGPSA